MELSDRVDAGYFYAIRDSGKDSSFTPVKTILKNAEGKKIRSLSLKDALHILTKYKIYYLKGGALGAFLDQAGIGPRSFQEKYESKVGSTSADPLRDFCEFYLGQNYKNSATLQ